MKIISHKKFPSIALLALILIAVGTFVAPQFALADTATPASTSGLMSIFGFSFEHFFNPLLASIGYTALIISTVFLRIAAALLDSAIYSTLHMSELVAQVQAIEVVWKIIRDFSSIFLIFMLLYSAITMILGLETQGFKKLVINIVIAGLLINFSLFFTKLAIDTSNIVALSFYKAIDAGGDKTASSGIQNVLSSSNGLSNGVMQGMRLQTILVLVNGKSDQAFGGYANGVDFKIVIVTVMGTVIIFIAALSFLAAAVMFAVRIAILILLMAFSPLFFVGMVIPAVQSKAKEWAKTLVGQCVFAPLYLMLMYVVLRVINDPAFGTALGLTGDAKTDSFSGAILTGKSVGIVIVYIMIILMINMALAAAKEYAGKAGEIGMKAHGLAKQYSKKWGTTGAQFISNQTTGRVMNSLAQSETLKDFASKNWVGKMALQATKGTAAGYAEQKKKAAEANLKFAESLGPNKSTMANLELGRGLLEDVHGKNESALNMARIELRDATQEYEEAKKSGNPARISAARSTLAAKRNAFNNAQTQFNDSKSRLKTAKGQITDEKNRRLSSYGGQMNRKASSIWGRVSGAYDSTSGQVSIKLEETKLEKLKDDLKTIKENVTRLEQRSKSKDGLTVDETKDLQDAYTDRDNKSRDIRASEAVISKYKNA